MAKPVICRVYSASALMIASPTSNVINFSFTRFRPLVPSPYGWQLDIETFEKAATPRTRMVLMSPGMPSGHVFTYAEWEAIVRIVLKTDAWLLYDAAMEKIVYNSRPIIHPASFQQMRERTITVGAASKELRMIGWRIGWIVGPKEIMNDIGLVSISNVVCQTGISMPGVTAGLLAADDGLIEALNVWTERRDALLNELKDFPVIPPHGGWSLLFDASAVGMTAQQLTHTLFNKAKIAATPMVGWGIQAEKYVRFVFSNEPVERLIGIGNKIKKALATS